MDSPDDSADHSAQEQSLGEAFWAVARQLRRSSSSALAPWDLTPSQARALMVLARHGAMRLSALSDHLHIAARSTTEVVDGLEARSLVSRSPDPTDRRATLVELTPQGRSVMDAISAARSEQAESLFARLSATDRDRLASILAKLQQPSQTL